MVIGNIFTLINDTATIDSDAVYGVVSIQSYTLFDNSTAQRFFNAEFSISQDSVVYTPFQQLTNGNLLAVVLDPLLPLYIRFRLTRAGTDTTGDLIFDKIKLCFVYQEKSCDKMYAHKKSIFFDIFCKNKDQIEYCDALFYKLYNYSIVPSFLDRQEVTAELGLDDKDYIAFFKTVACYYSLLKTLAAKLTQVYFRRDLAQFFLENKGHFLCGREELPTLQYIIQNGFDEIRRRGTNQVFKSHFTNTGLEIQGDVIRMLCKKPCDEFIYHLFKRDRFGWTINQCSPLYRSLFGEDEVTKIPSVLDRFGAYDYTPFILTTIGVASGTGGEVVLNTPGGTSYSGFTYIENQNAPVDFPLTHDLTPTELAKSYVVDPYLDYEITFTVNFQQTTNHSAPLYGLTFGAYAVDCEGKYVGLEKAYGFNGTLNTDFFVKTIQLGIGGTNPSTNYLVRGIIYAYGTPQLTQLDSKLDIETDLLAAGFPHTSHLRFRKNVRRIIPIVVNQNTGNPNSLNIGISDLQIRPLTTSFSRGFVQTPNFLNIWMRNNQSTMDLDELTDRIRHYFIPYNTVLHTQLLNNLPLQTNP